MFRGSSSTQTDKRLQKKTGRHSTKQQKVSVIFYRVTTDTAAVQLDCRTSDTAAMSVACYTLAAVELSQFVLSRSFKQCSLNAWLAQWSSLRIGPTRPQD